VSIAVLVAAGRGERLGADRPKAFVMLGGKPMLEWSVNALAPVVDHVVVALPPGEEPPPGTIGAEGGEHRSQSVRNALAAAPEGDPVVIHDAARPLITADLVREAIAALGDHDAAIAATPVADTIKEADGAGEVVRTLPRARRRCSAAQRSSGRWRCPTTCWPRPPTTPGSSSGWAGASRSCGSQRATSR
jgi:2-C-methyl-D-erythritol 4-phosphate cytidylyltransferase